MTRKQYFTISVHLGRLVKCLCSQELGLSAYHLSQIEREVEALNPLQAYVGKAVYHLHRNEINEAESELLVALRIAHHASLAQDSDGFGASRVGRHWSSTQCDVFDLNTSNGQWSVRRLANDYNIDCKTYRNIRQGKAVAVPFLPEYHNDHGNRILVIQL